MLPELNRHVEGAVTRMQYLADHLRRSGERALAECGLRREEHEVLHLLAGNGGRADLTGLAVELGTAPNALSELVDVLEQRDLVARTTTGGPSPEVVLTGEGRSVWLAAIETAAEEERRLFGVLDWHEQRLLAGLLRQIMLATGSDSESAGTSAQE